MDLRNDSRGSYWSTALNRRMGRRRALVLAGGSAASAAFVAACGGGDESSDGGGSGLLIQPVDTTRQAKVGGVIKDRTFADPPTLDVLTQNNPLGVLNTHVYSLLTQFKPGYMKPSENEVVGDVAESWETSADGLQITLKLRSGVKFHNKPPVNGRGLDMDDVLFSWSRFAAKYSSRVNVVNAVNPDAPVISLTATDSRTIVLKLKEPVVYALGLFATVAGSGIIMLPKETDSTWDPRGDMIGTGPFFMSNYLPSVGFTFKRNPEHWDKEAAFAEQVDLPIISEYSAALGQFRAGNIYEMGSSTSSQLVKQEDILPLKRDEPRIQIYPGDVSRIGAWRMAFGWLPVGKSPFLDERVRQAISMSWDRDLFIETFHNVSRFESEGLPLETRWSTALNPATEGWWLDPKSKDFGPNAKFFEHDLSEAKKLLAAAGYPNAIPDVTSNYVTGPELGDLPKWAEVVDGMVGEIGITPRVRSVDYLKEYAPLYRDGKGQYEGWAYMSAAGGGGGGGSAIGALESEFWSKGGSPAYKGFSLTGKNDMSGDPQVDALIERGRLERDTEKRKALVFDIQRHLGKTWYTILLPGVARGFTMAWPCLGNFGVYRDARPNHYLWVDDSKAPLKSS
jgi:ABC-type transport system substrate-binding protein